MKEQNNKGVKKRGWIRLLGFVLLAIALIIFGLQAAKEVTLVDLLPNEKITATQIAENQKKKTQNKDDVKPLGIEDVYHAKADPEDILAKNIGVIRFPTTDTSMLILNGTDNRSLMYGATTYRTDQEMGKGNYVLFGHNVQNGIALFSKVNQLKNGDEVIVSDLKNNYIYKVYEQKTIKDTDFEYVENTKDPILTLITCDRAYTTNQRTVVRAKYAGKQKDKSQTLNYGTINTQARDTKEYKIWLSVMIISLLLALIIIIYVIVKAIKLIRNK